MPIVSDDTTTTDSITGNKFIMLVNKALYYGRKLDHSLISPNKLRCYGAIVSDNLFDTNMDLCLKTYEGGTIDLIPDSTKIRFSL